MYPTRLPVVLVFIEIWITKFPFCNFFDLSSIHLFPWKEREKEKGQQYNLTGCATLWFFNSYTNLQFFLKKVINKCNVYTINYYLLLEINNLWIKLKAILIFLKQERTTNYSLLRINTCPSWIRILQVLGLEPQVLVQCPPDPGSPARCWAAGDKNQGRLFIMRIIIIQNII